jgi:BirA family biotin operon repressor/biotin-[acetyl-CoA-carboxylase] ligase
MSASMRTKEVLLAALRHAEDEWVSGAEFGAAHAISRAAVWKAVTSLRAAGYVIESVPNRGYRLISSGDAIDPDNVMERASSMIVGRGGIIILDEVDSTNRYAKVLAEKNASEGTIVIAKKQIAGRGRLGREWHSSDTGSLCMSVILKPECAPADVAGISLLATYAVYETVKRYVGDRSELKWPNDVLVGGKKIAGILVELEATIDEVRFAVVGIGINVNNRTDSFPTKINETATSLAVETKSTIDMNEFLAALVSSLDVRYAEFKTDGMPAVIARWRESYRMKGNQVTVTRRNETFTGKVIDIDDSGALCIEDCGGKKIRVFSGDTTEKK